MQIDYIDDKCYSNENIKLLQMNEQQKNQNCPQFLNILFDKPKVVRGKKKKNPLQLKQLIKRTKVSILTQNFIRKLKRTIVFQKIPQQILQKQNDLNFSDSSMTKRISIFLQKTQGINMNSRYQSIWSFINIIQISIITIIFSFMIPFTQATSIQSFNYIRIISIILFFSDMILNFITKRQFMGKTKKNLKDIGSNYLQNEFPADLIALILFPVSFTFQQRYMNIIILVVAILKLKNNLKNFQKFQYLYISNFQRQQYYQLFKVFLLNFAIGHILSILLNLMGSLQDQGWYDQKGIRDKEWTDRYVWGYYWGTTIMLTVGFGDISASNPTQAIVLIFVQTLSCITLAYNINCVGFIINTMKADNQQKKKKLKYFHKMCQQNQVCQQLQTKISNFIQQSYQIKQAFQFDQYQSVLQTLPKNMHSQYIKQSNKHLFQVNFFNSLNKKTLLSLAQSVVRRITHPDQIIKKKGQIADFMILQRGTIGLVCKRSKSLLNGTIIQTFFVQKTQKPKILSLDFIKRKVIDFDLKSLFYSVVYYLDYQKFMQSLKQSCQMDFDLFCVLRDKDDYIIGQNQLYQCNLCDNQFHNKFQCPKYHYCPLKQHVIAGYFENIRQSKQQRNAVQFYRQYRDNRALLYYKNINTDQKNYLQQVCNEEQLKQIQNLRKYYQQKNKRRKKSILQFKHDQFQKHMNKIQQLFVKHAHISDQFWNLQCDTLYDFKYYFHSFNPKNLHNTRMSWQGRRYEPTFLSFAQKYATTKSY